MCGAQSGYGHFVNCPFPYYGGDDNMMARWKMSQKNIVAAKEANNKAIADENLHPYPPGWGEPKGHGCTDFPPLPQDVHLEEDRKL
jgi:hypothetical protein